MFDNLYAFRIVEYVFFRTIPFLSVIIIFLFLTFCKCFSSFKNAFYSLSRTFLISALSVNFPSSILGCSSSLQSATCISFPHKEKRTGITPSHAFLRGIYDIRKMSTCFSTISYYHGKPPEKSWTFCKIIFYAFSSISTIRFGQFSRVVNSNTTPYLSVIVAPALA